jgi:hypothetical protein
VNKGQVFGVGGLDVCGEDEQKEFGFAIAVGPYRNQLIFHVVAPFCHGYGSDKDGDVERLHLTFAISERDFIEQYQKVLLAIERANTGEPQQ